MKRGNKIGNGTFGIVYSAKSPVSDKNYAVKRNLKVSETSFIGASREADLLCKLRNHPHLVHLDRVSYGHPFSVGQFSPLECAHNDDIIHFIFGEAVYDLHRYIYDVDPNDYDFYAVKRYMLHMLLGVEYMHENKIIHRDLKPSNVLIFGEDLDARGRPNVAKLCDFGMAKPFSYQTQKNTPGVVTSLYRAPEIVLDYPRYDYKSDIWSLGCIFFEMVARRSFIPLIDESNDALIMYIIERLPNSLTRVERSLITDSYRRVRIPRSMTTMIRKTYRQQIGFTPESLRKFESRAGSLDVFCDLLNNMLKLDWRERYNITQCLNHRFFDDLRSDITISRIQYPPISSHRDIIRIRECREREWMARCAVNIYKIGNRIRGYSHRALFQAMDLYDRYLSVMFHSANIAPDAKEPDNKGFIHDIYHSNLRFQTCFYLALKYFSSIHLPDKFEKTVSPEYRDRKALLIAEEFEKSFVVHCLGYNIYRDTLYECADKHGDILNEDDVSRLIVFYSLNHSFSGLTHQQLYDHYRTHLKGLHITKLSQHDVSKTIAESHARSKDVPPMIDSIVNDESRDSK